MSDKTLYEGAGDKHGKELPDYEPFNELTSAKGYLADDGLRDAVNVALIMGQPLLITGEPGTGKTRLANSIASEFGAPLISFHTKSTSSARDLFYSYDAVRHFRDATSSIQKPPEDYVSYNALGLAILLSLKERDPAINERLAEKYRDRYSVRSVVLIDEIDKAPRDLPNDVLNEFENMEFRVAETESTFVAAQDFRPVLILTSNSEKDLPDAFLRRCVFYHIDFPEGARLKAIVEKRLGEKPGFTRDQFDAAVGHFEEIRKLSLRKKPATAELLVWLRVLEKNGIDLNLRDDDTKRMLINSYALLVKYNDDRKALLTALDSWFSQNR